MIKNSYLALGLVSVLLVGGCSHDDDGHDHDQMHAPQLKAVGDHTVVVNRDIEIQLSALDEAGHQHNWIAEGVSGKPNPFEHTTPAVFDTSAGLFSWTATDAPLDSYLVRFSVADAQDSAAHDEEIVEIKVITPLQNGERIATTICSGCHGASLDGVGSWGPKIFNKTSEQIEFMRTEGPGPMKTNAVVKSLSSEDIEDVASYLATLGS